MATVTITYSGPADGQAAATIMHAGTVPDAAAPAFFACYRERYGKFFDATLKMVTNQPADQSGKPNALATDAQVFERHTQFIAAIMAQDVNSFAVQQAVQQAAAGVPQVAVTQTL